MYLLEIKLIQIRITRLNYFQVYSGKKPLHSLPRVAIALAEAQATEFLHRRTRIF
jgi:hypothetical protein